jgi:YD repeat-containing protein
MTLRSIRYGMVKPIRSGRKRSRSIGQPLKEYAGVSYRYDDGGNLVKRRQNGKRSSYKWGAFNRMTRAVIGHGVTNFAYDPLRRRIAKHSQALEALPSARQPGPSISGTATR